MLAVVGTFPSQQFVQEVTRDYFERTDHLVHERAEDIIEARNPGTGESWMVICLGDLSDDDTFDAAVGKLLQIMRPGDLKYAVAGPAMPVMYHHVSRIHPEIRDRLCLHYLLVNENAEVRADTQYFD